MNISRANYAKMIGVSRQRIERLVTKGVIVLERGKVNVSQADDAIKNMKDPKRDTFKRVEEYFFFSDQNIPYNDETVIMSNKEYLKTCMDSYRQGYLDCTTNLNNVLQLKVEPKPKKR